MLEHGCDCIIFTELTRMLIYSNIKYKKQHEIVRGGDSNYSKLYRGITIWKKGMGISIVKVLIKMLTFNFMKGCALSEWLSLSFPWLLHNV